MKIIRFLLINIILLFIVVFLISLFIPSQVRISRAVNMATQPAVVLDEISDLNKWKNWNPGFDSVKGEPLQTDSGRLTAMKINGTTYTIKQKTADEVIAEYRSEKGKSFTSGWKTIAYNHTDSLTVQWYFDFRLRWYPWEKMMSLIYDKSYGPGMEQGLQNLKKIAER